MFASACTHNDHPTMFLLLTCVNARERARLVTDIRNILVYIFINPVHQIIFKQICTYFNHGENGWRLYHRFLDSMEMVSLHGFQSTEEVFVNHFHFLSFAVNNLYTIIRLWGYVIAQKDRYSEGSLPRIELKGHYSEQSIRIIVPKGHYSEGSLLRWVIAPLSGLVLGLGLGLIGLEIRVRNDHPHAYIEAMNLWNNDHSNRNNDHSE